MIETTTILTGVGLIIGGIIAGIGGAKKLPLRRNNKSASLPIEISEKTGGARRISEEGLSKFNNLATLIEDKYMSLDKHNDTCGKQQAEMKLYISNELNDHTDKIIKAINGKKNYE